MFVKTLPVGQLQTNCYLVFNNQSRETVIIDPGDDADYIINTLKTLHLIPIALLATHSHFDHILAVTELKLAYNIPFYLHPKDLVILKRTESTARYFLKREVDPVIQPDHFIKEEQIISIGNLKLKVLETPGHTQGSICLYNKSHNIVFVGDLMFAGGSFGRTDLEGGNYAQLQQSIKKILKLPNKTIIYPGHGETTTVKKEKQFYSSI